MGIDFGLGPSPGKERLERYLGPLEKYLRSRAGLDGLAILPLESFGDVADELAAGKLHFGWLPAATFARSAGSELIKLLLQSIRGDSSSYHSVLFVRGDSTVETLADVHGKRVAWVSRDSSAGYLLAAHALKESGAEPGWESFEGSHAAVVRAVAEGDADAGATFCSIDPNARPNRIRTAGWTETAPVRGITFRPVATFGPIPGDVLCAGPGSSYAERAIFVSAMARMHLNPDGVGIVRGLFGADRFEIALPRHFQSLQVATERLAKLETR
ncbi:MAG: phosphate/phosphite/phosphonate ABC transporter substrate-binding protein [Deltaproteobacteria bacterium]